MDCPDFMINKTLNKQQSYYLLFTYLSLFLSLIITSLEMDSASLLLPSADGAHASRQRDMTRELMVGIQWFPREPFEAYPSSNEHLMRFPHRMLAHNMYTWWWTPSSYYYFFFFFSFLIYLFPFACSRLCCGSKSGLRSFIVVSCNRYLDDLFINNMIVFLERY